MDMNRNQKNEISPAVMALIFLFFIFPPFAIIGVVALMAYKQAKKNGQIDDRELRSELEHIKRSGMAAKEKFLRRLKEEDAAERPYQSKPHPHTPVSYSYDSCARKKRLEQLKVLKDAGLLDEMEYHQRRQAILAMG